MSTNLDLTAPAAAPWPLAPRVKTLAVNNYPMAYVEHGAGVPMVLVHGTNGDCRSFAPQMEPLGARCRAISVSLRHYYPEPWDGEGEFSARQRQEELDSVPAPRNMLRPSELNNAKVAQEATTQDRARAHAGASRPIATPRFAASSALGSRFAPAARTRSYPQGDGDPCSASGSGSYR